MSWYNTNIAKNCWPWDCWECHQWI